MITPPLHANIQDVRLIGKLAKTSQLQQSKYVGIKMDELSFLIVHCLGENPERKKRKERRFSQEDNKRGLPICHIVFFVMTRSLNVLGEGGLLLQLFLPTGYEGRWRAGK